MMVILEIITKYSSEARGYKDRERGDKRQGCGEEQTNINLPKAPKLAMVWLLVFTSGY